MARLLEKYRSDIVPKMRDQFSYGNILAVPSIEKITVSMGVGKTIENSKRLDRAVEDLALVTGQRPVISRARNSISAFRLREGVAIGCKVTLRGQRMFEFFDRLISVVIPRIRDFRGFDTKGFDGRGNYSLGLTEQVVFPEVNIDDVEFVQGMNVALTIENSTDEESEALLRHFGFPFRR